MLRGEIWWANLPEPTGAMPGHRRPVLIVQADAFTRSRIATIMVIIITSNLRLATAPGNVLLPASETGLPKDSVSNVSQIVTVNKAMLDERVGSLTQRTLTQVENGVRLALNL
jgi:mRNA interferase MazF